MCTRKPEKAKPLPQEPLGCDCPVAREPHQFSPHFTELPRLQPLCTSPGIQCYLGGADPEGGLPGPRQCDHRWIPLWGWCEPSDLSQAKVCTSPASSGSRYFSAHQPRPQCASVCPLKPLGHRPIVPLTISSLPVPQASVPEQGTHSFQLHQRYTLWLWLLKESSDRRTGEKSDVLSK